MALFESTRTSRWQARRQLRIEPMGSSLPPRWNVFDPLSRSTLRVGWLEHSLLRRLQRPTAIEDVAASLSSAVERIELLETLQQLKQYGLIYQVDAANWNPKKCTAGEPTSPGESQAAPSMDWTSWRQLAAEIWTSVRRLAGWCGRRVAGILAVQVRGPNPERLLRWLAPGLAMFFSTIAVKGWLALASVTGMLVLLDLEQLRREAGSLLTILQPASGGSLLLMVLLTRIAHELGHAIVATRHGIRCPDAGFFVFCGAPCLYCDVSESWLLTKRRERAAVAAGGMYTELIIATIAAWIWLASPEGWLHFLSMKLMLVCSVGSLLVNLNPLLRFDGYYILADWLDEANLRQRADRETLDSLRSWMRGKQALDGNQAPLSMHSGKRWFYVAYSCSSFLFRLLLSLGMAWAIAEYLESWQMELLGIGLALALLSSWWGAAIMRGITLIASEMSKRARQVQAAWAFVLLWGVLLLPLPVRHFAGGWVEPQQAIGVYAPEGGRLESVLVSDGEQVVAGQRLFQLVSPELQIARMTAASELAESQISLRHVAYRKQLRLSTEEYSRANVDEQHSYAKAAREQLGRADDRLQSLNVVAPIAGRFLCEPAGRESPSRSPHSTRTAVGSIQLQAGQGLRQGERLGIIANHAWRVMIPLDASQFSEVEAGTRVKLRIAQDQSSIVTAKVKHVVALDPTSDLWRPDNLIQPDQVASSAAIGAAHAAVVELPLEMAQKLDLRAGCSVDAVFSSAATSLFERLLAWCKLRWVPHF